MKTFTLSAPLRSASIVVALGTLVLAGCGGGGGGSKSQVRRGQVKINVTWPTSASRVIPANAQSILVQVKQGATVVNTATIARPANTATIADVPTGNVTVTASAYTSTDGTGTPLALATVSSTVTSNNTSTVDITMASTIDHLTVTPSPFILGATLSDQVNVTAYDTNGAVVMLSPSSLSFASSNTSLVSVTSTGAVTGGNSTGSGTISIADADSGKTLSLPINIVPTVTVTPSTSTIAVRGTGTFAATVVGPANTSVSWSIQEGASGGSITSGGVYTAPAMSGTFHVIATSVADTSRKATATVTVSSGSVGVTVH